MEEPSPETGDVSVNAAADDVNESSGGHVDAGEHTAHVVHGEIEAQERAAEVEGDPTPVTEEMRTQVPLPPTPPSKPALGRSESFASANETFQDVPLDLPPIPISKPLPDRRASGWARR